MNRLLILFTTVLLTVSCSTIADKASNAMAISDLTSSTIPCKNVMVKTNTNNSYSIITIEISEASTTQHQEKSEELIELIEAQIPDACNADEIVIAFIEDEERDEYNFEGCKIENAELAEESVLRI